MSGEKCKYTRIEDSELRRLREQESRLRSVQQNLPELLNAVKEEGQREFQQRLAPLEQRAQRQEEEAQKLKSNLAQLEQETQKRLQKQRQEFQSAVRDVEYRQKQAIQRESTRLESAARQGFEQQRSEYLRITYEQRQEYTQLISSQEQKFTQLIVEEQQARLRGQQILQEQIEQIVSEIQQDKQQQAQFAQDLLSDVEVIWQGIERDYQHQRFAPGCLSNLRREIDLAQANIQLGVSQAAIATAQKTYLALVDLRTELEQKEQEWLLVYNVALEDLKSLIAEVQANRNCEIEVGEGTEAETFKLEIDYWTSGSLSQYEQQLSQLESHLIAGNSTLTTEQVKDLGNKITSLQSRLGEVVEQARQAILSSQMRAEIADQIVGVLSSLGYDLVAPEKDAVYEGEDQRAAYAVKMTNAAGDEVVTVISPEKEFGMNSISINTFSQTLIDETATQQNAEAVFQLLNQEGVKSSGPLMCNQEAQQKYHDLEEVKKPKVAPAPLPAQRE